MVRENIQICFEKAENIASCVYVFGIMYVHTVIHWFPKFISIIRGKFPKCLPFIIFTSYIKFPYIYTFLYVVMMLLYFQVFT